jgi:hypothetical protein
MATASMKLDRAPGNDFNPETPVTTTRRACRIRVPLITNGVKVFVLLVIVSHCFFS